MADLEVKFTSELYDVLYNTADLILKKYDPCGFENGKCRFRDNCCHNCNYLSPKGCAVKALSCKLWLCKEARKNYPECAAALDSLSLVADRYHFWAFRTRKEDIIM